MLQYSQEPSAHTAPETLYSIGEAADVLAISIPTIRMYEREGLIIPIRRTSRHRRFSATDLERIRCLRRLINEEKVSIAGAKRLLALLPCWKITNCPEATRNKCAAFTAHDGPCWLQTGKSPVCRSADCRACPVYAFHADCHTIKQTISTLILGAGTVACEVP